MNDQMDQPECGRVVDNSRKSLPYENLVNEVWHSVISAYLSPTNKFNLVVVLKTNYIFMTNGGIINFYVKFIFKIDSTKIVSVFRLVLHPGTMRLFESSL